MMLNVQEDSYSNIIKINPLIILIFISEVVISKC